MLTHRGRPIFASEGPRRRVLPWSECLAMMAALSLLGWLVVFLAWEVLQ